MKEGMRDVLKPGKLPLHGGQAQATMHSRRCLSTRSSRLLRTAVPTSPPANFTRWWTTYSCRSGTWARFIDNLNMAGEILKSGRLWKVA